MTPRQEEARRLALSGLTVKQIAAEMMCSRQGVEKYLKATGTQPHRVVKYTDEQIKVLAEDGLTDTDIACQLGICSNTVLNVRHRLGIERRCGAPLILSSIEVARLLDLAQQGWRQVDIAKKFGVSQNTVSRILINNGLRSHTKRTAKQ